MASENYISQLNRQLSLPSEFEYSALDLFSGAGGLSLGFEAAGFRTIGVEIDDDCCATYNKNLKGQCEKIFLDKNFSFPKADVIIGGPPCQPFSERGKRLGTKDSRDGFPVFIEAVRQIQPKFWLFENVRGLFYHKDYLRKIIRELEDLGYSTAVELVNAADYGVPQNRFRVFAAGFKGSFEFPAKQRKKVTAGEALGELVEKIPDYAKFLTPQMDEYVAKYEKASKCRVPRDLHLDRPARTLTCRNLGGATSDMHRIRLPDGRRRRLTIREAARLQTFPDWFEFSGGEISAFAQIGNAVPPYLAYQIAQKAKECLAGPAKGAARKRIQTKLASGAA